MARSASERLRRFYEKFSSDDNVLVIIYADPDAIASAMAVSRLLWRKTVSVTISNLNIIKRPDNLAMVRLLGVNLIHIDKIDQTRFSRIVMVDSQPDHHEAFTTIIPDVIIDHHPDTGISAPFLDIRPTYGATATIMTEYIKAAKIKPSIKLATGLFHAIKTDTSNFERQTLIEDVRAFLFLFKHANIHLARRIEHADMRIEFLKYFKRALENIRRCKNRVFIHLGPVTNPDVCVLIADFFMRVDSINWSIVSGICDKKLIIIFRNDGLRMNAGVVAKQSFGKVGSAGGHKGMARAEIFLVDLMKVVDHRYNQKLQRWIINRIERKTRKNVIL